METRGLILIWGFLALSVTSIVFGFYFKDVWYGALAQFIGFVGLGVWVVGVFMLLNAMNSDI